MGPEPPEIRRKVSPALLPQGDRQTQALGPRPQAQLYETKVEVSSG